MLAMSSIAYADEEPAITIESEAVAVAGYSYRINYQYNYAEGYDLVWSSSNTDVALVDNYGMVDPLCEGTAEITVSITGTEIEKKCILTVIEPKPEKKYTLTKEDINAAKKGQPGMIYGGIRQNSYGYFELLPAEYTINEDLDLSFTYIDDNKSYLFKGDGSITVDRWNYSASVTFENFTVTDSELILSDITFDGGNYSDSILYCVNDIYVINGFFSNVKIYGMSTHFQIDDGTFNNCNFDPENNYPVSIINGGTFNNSSFMGRILFNGGTFTTDEDYALDVSDRFRFSWFIIKGGCYCGKKAALCTGDYSQTNNRLELYRGEFDNGTLGAIIVKNGSEKPDPAGSVIETIIDEKSIVVDPVYKIVSIDGSYCDVARGKEKAVCIKRRAQAITITNDCLNLFPGDSLPLLTAFEPEGAYLSSINWRSDNESVAIVNNEGVVTGVDYGTANITASSPDGTITATCTITVLDKEHTYGEWITDSEPTCVKKGSKHKVCSKCGDRIDEDIAALGHAWNKEPTVDIKPTCTTDGLESVHCSRCNTVKDGSKKTITKTGHSFSAWATTKNATELATGRQSHKCSACGITETSTIVQLKPTLPAVTITKPAVTKKSATIKWKKVSKKNQKKNATIQIQYSRDKKFKKDVKKKLVSAKKTSYKIKGLKSKKKYYIRIRAYTKTGTTKHVSKWSAVKVVKAK